MDALFGTIIGLAILTVILGLARAFARGYDHAVRYDELTHERLHALTEGDLAALEIRDVDAWLELRRVERRMTALRARAAAARSER
ncbi:MULTISPECIES: hypothetical protein [unclassified Microbacterium]|uniref:hypothetical protein n=1 Tax=unclassified Microbacterium TaxID=2609290 RepID=UPI0025E55CC7|nr:MULTISPECIES: hypothetical protein [unclassified Microbacterium]